MGLVAGWKTTGEGDALDKPQERSTLIGPAALVRDGPEKGDFGDSPYGIG